VTKRLNRKKGVSRKFGVNLWGREDSPFVKRNYPTGEHGRLGYSRPTDFGVQLRAKQMIKAYYCNVNERQFRAIYKEALRRRGDTGQNLVGLLESRLDAFVYRAKLAVSMHAARQLISHKHLTVNDTVVNIPSYRLKVGDVVKIRERSANLECIKHALSVPYRTVPYYIDASEDGVAATFIKIPELSEIPYGIEIQPNLVTEFYSR